MNLSATFRRKFAFAASHARKRVRANGEAGSTLVETAVSILILLSFLLGIMEISLAGYTYHIVAELAQEGTRYAMIRGSTAAGSAGTACAAPGPPTCVAQSADIQSFVKNFGFPGIDPSKMTVTPTWSAFASGSPCPGGGPCNSPGNSVTVQVQYNFPIAVPFVSIRTISMSSTSSMIIAQ
jgi:Flp pilus assembly protein TadG